MTRAMGSENESQNVKLALLAAEKKGTIKHNRYFSIFYNKKRQFNSTISIKKNLSRQADVNSNYPCFMQKKNASRFALDTIMQKGCEMNNYTERDFHAGNYDQFKRKPVKKNHIDKKTQQLRLQLRPDYDDFDEFFFT